MIVSTDKSATMLRRTVGRDKAIVISADKIFAQLSLDPTTTTPARDAYIITNEDISAKRVKEKFEAALLNKHPGSKVIFINRSMKPIYPNGLPGLDAILQKPKPDDIVQAISAVIANNQVSSVVTAQMPTSAPIPDYVPETVEAYEPEPVKETVEVEDFEIPTPEPEPVKVEVPVDKESGIIQRIKSAGTVGDTAILVRELTATSLIKDLHETNSTYAGIEEKLKSLNDVIFNIMGDCSIKSLDEKISKVRSIIHDKAFFHSKGGTIIEQRLEEVIDTICEQVSSLLQSRLGEIDDAIRRSIAEKDMGNVHARLAGLNEERANLIIELQTLQVEITDMYKSIDSLTVQSATHLARQAEDMTGNQAINDILKARDGAIIDEGTIDAIRAAIELSSDKVPTTFKKFKMDILNMMQLLRKTFELDSEIIAAQQSVINYLKSNNIENTVVAETLLKKSLRVFIGEETTGTTIIPYLMSKYKSRQNANVLLIDLTGTAKYTQYGIKYTQLDTYLVELNQREFMLAAGTIDNSIAAAQRLVTALVKAADYYRVINIVVSPEQQLIFETIAQDVLSVNFLVDTNVQRIERMKRIIEENTFVNVARRVIINKCNVPIRSIIDKLGLNDTLDVQVCVIPTVNEITDASLNSYDPYGISRVDLAMEEVLKHA